MVVVESYPLAVVLCVITMLCWGSWANTQKLTGRRWRFELFYWDYALGVFLTALVLAFTLGSWGTIGRPFWTDIAQAESAALTSAVVGGVIFNVANILLVAAIALSGMSVAFPVGIGLALVLGVIFNYWAEPRGEPLRLASGVGLVVMAMMLAAAAHRRLPGQRSGGWIGLALAVLAGGLMGLFYRFVAASMANDFVNPESGRLGPYAAITAFALGIFLSNFLINPLLMRWPVSGEPLTARDYFQGCTSDHVCGLIGGFIWCIGMTLSIVAAGVAGPAVSYGLGQGATLVAAIWGVFVWREFREAPAGTMRLIALMFASYVTGLGMIVWSGA